MATVIINRGSDVKLQNTPNIDGMIYFNTDNHTIVLDDGTNREIYGGTTPMITSVASGDGASNSNTYSALAAKNGFCIKSNVADSASNINNTTENGRPVGCVGFKAIVGTTDISSLGNTVKEAVSNIGNRLVVNNNKFVFDYQNGKWGFNTSESRGADTFHPFSSTALSMLSTFTSSGTTFSCLNTDILATNVELKVNTTTDAATTSLPVDFTTGTGAVTCSSGFMKATDSGSTGGYGGVIHLFNDTNHGKPEGNHAHYIYMGQWYTASNKTPIGDTSFYPSTDGIQVGLPFVIPFIVREQDDMHDDRWNYRRYDRLKYFVCRNANNKCYMDFFEYGSLLPRPNAYISWGYTQMSWVKQANSLEKNIPSDVTNYQIGSHKTMVWYHGRLHIFGGTYTHNGTTKKDTNHYIFQQRPSSQTYIEDFYTYDEIPITEDFINYDIYATLVHNDAIYIFYNDTAHTPHLRYITYTDNGFGEGGTVWSSEPLSSPIDEQSQWVEYNGEIHILGGYVSNKLHIALNDSDLGNTNYNMEYAALKYPFRDSIACVAPPTYTSNSDNYDYTSLESSSMLSTPTYIHYMGTAQANPSSGNYRKKHYQIQNTYLASIHGDCDSRNFDFYHNRRV